MGAGDNKKIEHINFPYKDYVLALPGWYPTWLGPLPGDFNQRHIKAASLYTPQIVLYIGKDQTGTLKKTETRITQPTDTIVEYIVVYPKISVKWFDAIYSNATFLLLLFECAGQIKSRFGKPTLLHSYIVMRGGLAGWLLKMKWKIPFILSENWTIYYPADPGYLLKRNYIFKWLVKKVFSRLDRFLPVTNDLQQRAAYLVGAVPSTIVPNVVETDTFNLNHPATSRQPFRFIHVSTMIYQKNPEGLLLTFKRFKEQYKHVVLQMVGPYPNEVFKYADSIGLSEEDIRFTGAVSYNDVSDLLKMSNALVLFSRYENLPCVILEAFCCGLPVISTTVGGIAEVINEENGILIESENEEQLLEAFIKIYSQYDIYNKQVISTKASDLFSYNAIGKKIATVYKELTQINS